MSDQTDHACVVVLDDSGFCWQQTLNLMHVRVSEPAYLNFLRWLSSNWKPSDRQDIPLVNQWQIRENQQGFLRADA